MQEGIQDFRNGWREGTRKGVARGLAPPGYF